MVASGKNNLDNLLSNRVDPSAGDFSEALDAAYRDMNITIATSRAHYAHNLQADHLDYSHEDIYATAQEALTRAIADEERTALILGAGGCGDIPLADIVSEFDKTVLVDTDTSQTECALGALPFAMLGKISLIKADVAGVAKGFDRAFGQAFTAKNYKQYTQRAAEILRGIDITKSRFDPGQKYSFVCSHLLATQLVNIPIMYLGPVSAERFNRSFDPFTPSGADDVELVEAIRQQLVDIPTGHIDHLRHLVKDNGTVHFADTLTARVGGRWLRALTSDVFTRIDTNFDRLRGATTWEFWADPELGYQVGSFALAPKDKVVS